MIITNKYGLPQTLVDAIIFSDKAHQQGDYSASQLSKGAKQLWLTKRHDDEITIDASDRLWALFGTAIHYVLDKGDDKNVLKEEYLETKILNKSLTGKPDHFDGKILTDWKFTSVWSVVYESSYKDYEKQLNTYAFMYGLVGFEVEKIQACLMLKDWSKRKMQEDRNGTYPPCQFKLVDKLKLWPATKQREYIEGRITEFEAFKDAPDNLIPECNDEERWKKEDKWAIMKGKNKRATKVCDTEEQAEKFLETNEGDYAIVPRPGLDNKCIDYCDCNKFCHYWQEKYGQNKPCHNWGK